MCQSNSILPPEKTIKFLLEIALIFTPIMFKKPQTQTAVCDLFIQKNIPLFS